MDVREKLVEIVCDAMERDGCIGHCNNSPCFEVERVVNALIANGITVQEWISVKDGLPKNGKEGVLIALRWGEVDIGWCEDGQWGSEFINEYEDGEVTHWMPLPQPPKGE